MGFFTNLNIGKRLAIGFALTLIHLISIPVTNTSVNPARSTAVAVYVGDWATDQLWLFWVAPVVGALLGAAIYRLVGAESPAAARANMRTPAHPERRQRQVRGSG